MRVPVDLMLRQAIARLTIVALVLSGLMVTIFDPGARSRPKDAFGRATADGRDDAPLMCGRDTRVMSVRVGEVLAAAHQSFLRERLGRS